MISLLCHLVPRTISLLCGSSLWSMILLNHSTFLDSNVGVVSLNPLIRSSHMSMSTSCPVRVPPVPISLILPL